MRKKFAINAKCALTFGTDFSTNNEPCEEKWEKLDTSKAHHIGPLHGAIQEVCHSRRGEGVRPKTWLWCYMGGWRMWKNDVPYPLEKIIYKKISVISLISHFGSHCKWKWIFQSRFFTSNVPYYSCFRFRDGEQKLLSIIYFVSYMIMINLIIINMYIAVILENFNQAQSQDEVILPQTW